MAEEFDWKGGIDRRTLLCGTSAVIAVGLVGPLWNVGASGFAASGRVSIGSDGLLASGESADVVLRGDRLDRLVQLRNLLSEARPLHLGLKIDDTDRVMLDVALAERRIHQAPDPAGGLLLTYGKGKAA